MMGSKEYRFAVALLQFNRTWEELVKASVALPDLDVSELYPFYLLDFEELQPAVKQWCMHHASKIMQQVPDVVYNPACAMCPYVSAGLDEDGLCKGLHTTGCSNHPTIMFTTQAVTPFLLAHNVDVQGQTPEALQLLYTRKVEELNEKARS